MLQTSIEDATCRTCERPALPALVITRLLPYQQQAGLRKVFPEYRPRALL
jgi:hypothetical protein